MLVFRGVGVYIYSWDFYLSIHLSWIFEWAPRFFTMHPFSEVERWSWKESPQNFTWIIFGDQAFFEGRIHNSSYCWWFRNPANQLSLVVYPIIYRVLHIPGGAGFLPSTVCPSFFSFFFFWHFVARNGGRFWFVLRKKLHPSNVQKTSHVAVCTQPIFFCPTKTTKKCRGLMTHSAKRVSS